jgi:hypothetical protein
MPLEQTFHRRIDKVMFSTEAVLTMGLLLHTPREGDVEERYRGLGPPRRKVGE